MAARRFSVLVPSAGEKNFSLHHLEVASDGLKVWGVMEDKVVSEYKLEETQARPPERLKGATRPGGWRGRPRALA